MDSPSQTSTPLQFRASGISSSIPQSEDPGPDPVTTRGQRLQRLLQSRSSPSVFRLPRRETTRRGSFHSHHSTEDEAEYGIRGVFDDPESLFCRRTPSEMDPRRMSLGPEILLTPQMRSMRLIGQSNPRYHWQQYYKTEDELKKMKKHIRKYYERNNFLITQYTYIDKLLDSSLPHNLIQEYGQPRTNGVMNTISEHPPSQLTTPSTDPKTGRLLPLSSSTATDTRLKRTPKNLYKLPAPNEATPLLKACADEAVDDSDNGAGANTDADGLGIPDSLVISFDDMDEGVDSDDPVVTVAIYVNLMANIILLAGKIAVCLLTSSLSVLASLVDAALDFLSTAIVWTTAKMISHQDQYAYPIGRRRLEPVGVLVFSVIMITSFCQVSLECCKRLISPDHSVVELGVPAIAIMSSTVAIKGFCWFWCRLVKNSSVQALAQDAATDVVFNLFSIIIPLIGFYAHVWWMDALGGLVLSLYVIFNWSRTSTEHIRHLCGVSATPDQRKVLLYLTMRFAKTIRYIQGLHAYHTGDKLNVEVDIVLDEKMDLRDSHDLSESLQYVLESVPTVDRAFVHADYADWNIPSHMNQQA